MTVEAEVSRALAEVLRRLDFRGARIHVNHRAMLRAIILKRGRAVELETEALVAIDKLDKIGEDGVIQELGERGISEQSVQTLMELIGVATQGTPGEFDNAHRVDAGEALADVDQGARPSLSLRTLLALRAAGPAGPLICH